MILATLDRWRHKIPFWWWLTYDALVGVVFSPLSAWVLPALCESCGCELEGGHCYCCQPVMGYGERFYDTRHPNGIENAGRLVREAIPLDQYVPENNS